MWLRDNCEVNLKFANIFYYYFDTRDFILFLAFQPFGSNVQIFAQSL